jgi:hypothetical protein
MRIRMFRIIALFALGAFAGLPFGNAQAKAIAGDWQGTLDAGGQQFRIVWHVEAAVDGTLNSSFDNVDEGAFGIKAKSTTLKGSDVAVAVDDMIQINGQSVTVKGIFAGTLNKDGKEVAGTWTQTEPEQAPAQVLLKHADGQAAATHPTEPAAAPPTIAGVWKGVLMGQLHLVLHISAAKEGTLSATLDSVDQSANGIPVSAIMLKDSKLSLTVDAVHGTYEGTVSKDGDEIDGTWSQGQSLELNFKRAAAAQPAAAATTH